MRPSSSTKLRARLAVELRRPCRDAEPQRLCERARDRRRRRQGAVGAAADLWARARREAEWLPYLADAVGAKPPRHVPLWLGRLMAGEALATMMTEGRGASNAKAKRELGWQLLYPSWREGFVNGLGEDTRRAA
jgi:hypothetical protein